MDHISKNLANYEENLTASLSRLEDTDMASQSMKVVKYQLLSQAQTALFAKAQTSNQQVLELLK